MTSEARMSRRVLLGAGISAGVLGVTGVTAGPRIAGLGAPTGDGDLAAALAPRLTGHRRVVVAVLEAGAARTVGFGADDDTTFEIGSITKTFTGALLMAAVERGEVGLDTTVRQILGSRVGTSEVGDVTLAELAAHTSGLPRLPAIMALTSLPRTLLRKDPYAGQGSDAVIAAALASPLLDRGTSSYSNLGVALLGQLVAMVGGASWQELLETRLTLPLGLPATGAALTANALPAAAPTGRTRAGLRAAAWTMDGYAPAGGIRSTLRDMVRYLQSMIDGSNPGAQGLEPIVTDERGNATGVVWVHTPRAEQTIVWHNGMTGGFASFCGWVAETGRGVVVLTDTASSVDELGVEVLTGEVT